MNSTELKQALAGGAFLGSFQTLYGDAVAPIARYTAAVEQFEALFGHGRQVLLFSAPGRTEVGGNHTDHQHGCVLAGSVNLDVIAVASPNDENIIRIKSEGYPQDDVRVQDVNPIPAEEGKAISLIRGMSALVQQAGYKVGGFDAYTTSNVLKGSGLSSSAAFEVLVGVILNHLYCGGKLTAVDIAKMAQKAENIYFGKPCGLMDQTASSVGGFTAIDFADPANPIIEKVEFDLDAVGHSLCVVNTGGNHADLTQDYADITVECKQVAEYFGKGYLREVDEAMLYANIAPLREKFGDRAVLRAIHFMNDNRRAVDEAAALKNKDFPAFLALVNQSGDSSFKYLQNVYSTSALKEQGLALALALAQKVLGGRGAHRVHGGGFAGTIQAFVPNDLTEAFIATMESAFGKGNCYVLKIRPVGGTAVLPDKP